jgi:hypothetical protein
VMDGNIMAVVRRPWSLLVLGGLEHRGANRGTLSVLDRDTHSGWHGRTLAQLPGMPIALRTEPDGGLSIATRGGVVSVACGGQRIAIDDHAFPFGH